MKFSSAMKLLIAAGSALAVAAVVFRDRNSNPEISRYTTLLGWIKPDFKGKPFDGVYTTTILGGTELDLTDARISNGAVIDCAAAFGSVKVKLPPEVNIEYDNFGIAAACTGPRKRDFNADYPIVHVRVRCLLGSADVGVTSKIVLDNR